VRTSCAPAPTARAQEPPRVVRQRLGAAARPAPREGRPSLLRIDLDPPVAAVEQAARAEQHAGAADDEAVGAQRRDAQHPERREAPQRGRDGVHVGVAETQPSPCSTRARRRRATGGGTTSTARRRRLGALPLEPATARSVSVHGETLESSKERGEDTTRGARCFYFPLGFRGTRDRDDGVEVEAIKSRASWSKTRVLIDSDNILPLQTPQLISLSEHTHTQREREGEGTASKAQVSICSAVLLCLGQAAICLLL
jgi:hypothetical protein